MTWGGTDGCEHEWGEQHVRVEGGGAYSGRKRWQHLAAEAQETGVPVRDIEPGAWGHPEVPAGMICRRCRAWRGQYGLEPTPELYVEHTIAVLRAVRRVLKPTGVCWWNIGDGYASNPAKGGSGTPNGRNNRGENYSRSSRTWGSGGLKAKDLVLMPERVALAAQADGWWVRSRIAWTKPNPMPESVRDRPTDAWEHIYLFTKSGRALYWTHPDGRIHGWPAETRPPTPDYRWTNRLTKEETATEPEGWRSLTDTDGHRIWSRRNLWDGHDYWWDAEAVREAAQYGRREWNGDHYSSNGEDKGNSGTTLGGDPTSGRNLRNVWEFPTAPFPAAHFATFPPELPARCIKAACPPDGTVLDCFAGSGTTLVVARQLGRRAIGIELSEEYAQMAIERLRYGTKGLMQVAHGQAPLPLGEV